MIQNSSQVMGRRNGVLLAVVIPTIALAMPAFAADLLDQTLGPAAPAATVKPEAPKAASPEPVKPAAESTAAPTPPVGGSDIASPDAVRKVDDSDLIDKLTKPDDATPKGNPAKQQMVEMLDRMGKSQKLLTDKDPGLITQETQRRIVADLDVLIEYARQQQQNGPSQSDPNKQPGQGQQRQYSDGQKGPHNEGGTTAAQESTLPAGSAQTPRSNGNIHSQGPEEWGALPPRARDLIAHGANEEYLSSYRDMIDRYYQALAQLGKSRNH